MIHFRCWYCNKAYLKPDAAVGQTLACSCSRTLRVPTVSHGNCRVKTVNDRLSEAFVYGGSGALCCFLLSAFLATRMVGVGGGIRLIVVVGATLAGGLLGTFVGEPFINWIGQMLRERTQR